MDGAYSVLGRHIFYSNPNHYAYAIISADKEIPCRQMQLEYYLQVCPLQSIQGQSNWEEMSGWISALWPQAINFLLMTMVMGVSGSSGVQTTFC